MIGISKVSWFVSIVLHGALLALLILGPSLRPTLKPDLPSGNFMPAELIDLASLDLPPLEQPLGPTPAELERERLAQELEQQRLEEQAKKEREDEQERLRVQEQQAEEERIRVKKEAEAEAKRVADAQKKAEELKKEQARLKKIEDDKKEKARIAKEKAEEAEKEKARIAAEKEAERIEKEKEEERKRLEAKKKADEEKRLAKEKREKAIAAEKAAKQKAAAKKLADQLAREEQMRQMMGVEDQRNKAVDNGLLAQYIAQIVAKVERNWNRPPGAKEGLSCTVKATQIPGGDVASVEVVKCNGDAVVQRSIEAAVFKASPLPEPADSTLFERNLVFIFEPR